MYSYRLNLRLYQALVQALIVESGGGGGINNSMIVFPVFLYFLFVRYGIFFRGKTWVFGLTKYPECVSKA